MPELWRPDESTPPKVLIVERKLLRNRGHHHTQIAGIRSFLPEHALHLIAGDGYDGFLGPAEATISKDAAKMPRLSARMRYGTPRQKITAGLKIATRSFRGAGSPPVAGTLRSVCRRLGMTSRDLVVIPTADLDMLEAASILALDSDAPVFCLRFLGENLGEFDDRIRKKRILGFDPGSLNRLALFTETTELAAHLSKEFRREVQPAFYLPCSIDMRSDDTGYKAEKAFRVGIFGAPRPDKGSIRLPGIVRAVRAQAAKTNILVKFVIQGSLVDFGPQGVYRELAEFQDPSGNIEIEKRPAQTPGDEFVRIFRSVDAVLLPYDVNTYRLQGSGVVQDAVAARKLVVYSAGMSMTELLEHGNGLPAERDEDFARAILSLATIDDAERKRVTSRAHASLRAIHEKHPLLRLSGMARA